MEEENTTPKYLSAASIRFCLKLPDYKNNEELKKQLLDIIIQENMAPYYKSVCEEFNWPIDVELFKKMIAANAERIKQLEKEQENDLIDDDEDEVSGLWQAKLEHMCGIGDELEASALAESKFSDVSLPKSHRLDAAFALFRIAYFHGCKLSKMKSAIAKATELIETGSGGDWSSRNKLKAYEGIMSLAVRDFSKAADLFVDVAPTFESYELTTFGTVVKYTVYACMIALPRCDLKKKIMHHGVMAQALTSDYTDLKDYFSSLYDCRYADFFICLAKVEKDMKADPLLFPHYRHYVREMRIRAYKQILQAYRSLSLSYMAESFGVSVEFIDKELAHFSAAGRLACKIDAVSQQVITSNYVHGPANASQVEAPESTLARGALYSATVKKGDILLNRIKKLSRIIED